LSKESIYTCWQHGAHIYKTIIAHDLQTLAQKYFDRKDFYKVVVV
jgi:hypothetical protein